MTECAAAERLIALAFVGLLFGGGVFMGWLKWGRG